jgi:hypothetical protein
MAAYANVQRHTTIDGAGMSNMVDASMGQDANLTQV